MNKIDGKSIALSVKDKVKDEINLNNYDVSLVVIQVGEDPASSVYVRNKEKACEYIKLLLLMQVSIEQRMVNLLETAILKR